MNVIKSNNITILWRLRFLFTVPKQMDVKASLADIAYHTGRGIKLAVKRFFTINNQIHLCQDIHSLISTSTAGSTLWAIKKRDTFIFVITLANIDRFSYFFTTIFSKELRNKNLLKFSPHLKSVAALPCETWNVKCSVQLYDILFITDGIVQII